ncbi:hypothetical protein [Naasia sp. SYSU D00948]|uniref:hypothetical protein n=1 Tax=Naasia sp. SYSU D00948 TaxID=2817379 RepID=UPI001B30421B|nr:hypothetical protein [Naasia sp. SYSU D00948]
MSTGRGDWFGPEPVRGRGVAQVAALVALVLTGVVLIALPDRDDRVFTLSPEHGPAPLDLVGSILVTAGWLGIVARPLVARRRVGGRAGRRALSVCLFAAGVGVGLIAASIFSQLSWWWAVGAAILVAVQLYFVALSIPPRG